MQAALESVPGVRTAEVDFFSREAYVTFDPKLASVDQMSAALEKEGYRGMAKHDGKPQWIGGAQ